MTAIDIAAIGKDRACQEWSEDPELATFMTLPELIADCVEATFWKAAFEGQTPIIFDVLQLSLKIAKEMELQMVSAGKYAALDLAINFEVDKCLDSENIYEDIRSLVAFLESCTGELREEFDPDEEFDDDPIDDEDWVDLEEDDLMSELEDVIGDENLPTWLKTPNQAFGGRWPQELIDDGKYDELRQMIHLLKSGEPA